MVAISVIIPNYNHEKYLKQRIETVIGQDFDDFEVIILDDNSTDNSVDIIKQYSGSDKLSGIYINDKNSGSVFKQWNRGVDLAKGEYIWIAESDDFSDFSFLKKVYKKIKEHNVGLAFVQSNKVNDENFVYGDWISHTQELDKNYFLDDFKLEGREFIKRFMINQNSIPNASAVVFKKEFYVKAGYASESLKTIGDWGMWVKILNFTDIYFISDKLNYFRMHNNSCVALSNKNDQRSNIILMHAFLYYDLSLFFGEYDIFISEIYFDKYNFSLSRFFWHCFFKCKFKDIYFKIYKNKLYKIFITKDFYMVFCFLFINFILNKKSLKI